MSQTVPTNNAARTTTRETHVRQRPRLPWTPSLGSPDRGGNTVDGKSVMPDLMCDNAFGGLGSGSGSEDVSVSCTTVANEFHRCNVCLKELPLDKFPRNPNGTRRGMVCILDDEAVESLQRMLRRAWGNTYKQRWPLFKKEKVVWRQVVLSLVIEEGGHKKKTA